MISLSNLDWTPGNYQQVIGRLERGNNPWSLPWNAVIDANNPWVASEHGHDMEPWIDAIEANNPTG